MAPLFPIRDRSSICSFTSFFISLMMLEAASNKNNANDFNFRLLKSAAAEEAFNWLNSVLKSNPLLLRELDLSFHKPGDSGVKKLSDLLLDSHCKIRTIKYV